MKKFFLSLITTLLVTGTFAQNNVGIGTTTPDASAVLDVTSTSKGMLVPRVSTAQRLGIANPATGLLVFDVTVECFFYYNGTWNSLCSATGATGAAGSMGITGATGTAGGPGVTGATGANGNMGPTGIAGTQGPTGPTGAAGTRGTDGATGITGATGTAGVNGITGPTGAVGPLGVNGATGASGATGPSGFWSIVYITPVTIIPSTTGTYAWTTFDASLYIPVTAKAVILEAEGAQSGPDNGTVDAYIYIRQTGGTSQYLMLRGRAASSGDDVAESNQGFFPCTNAQFDYELLAPGFNLNATMRLIGYLN